MKKQEARIPLGQKLSPILSELEDALWDFEYAYPNEPAKYSIIGFRGATKIFMSCLLDKMWERQENKLLSKEEREQQATEAGKEVRALIKKYTGIDSHDLYKI